MLLMEILTAVLPMILDHFMAPIKRYIGYVLQFRSKLNELGDQVKFLELERESLQRSIDGAQRRGEDVATHVLGWRTRADTAIAEAQALIRNGEEEARRGWFCRLTTRYRMAKKASDGTSGIVQLLEEKSRLGTTISHHRHDLHQIFWLPLKGYVQQLFTLPPEGHEPQSRTKIAVSALCVMWKWYKARRRRRISKLWSKLRSIARMIDDM